MDSLNHLLPNPVIEPLEAMHVENLYYISACKMYKYELKFFGKLLEHHVNQITTPIDLAHLEQLQNKLIYYTGEVVDVILHNLKQHENFLSTVLLEIYKREEMQVREQHYIVKEEFLAFEEQMRELKKDLFTFVEAYM